MALLGVDYSLTEERLYAVLDLPRCEVARTDDPVEVHTGVRPDVTRDPITGFTHVLDRFD